MMTLPPPPPPPGLPQLQQGQPGYSSFCEADHLREHLRNARETLDLVRAMQKELELILITRSREESVEKFGSDMQARFSETIRAKRISLDVQESLSLEAAKSLILTLRYQLLPLNAFIGEQCSWEEKSMAVRLAQKMEKSQRNKRWRKRKRQHVAEALRMEHENYDKADREADEWREREIAKDNARHKVEKMKEIAKLKANEEKRRLEAELELVLMVEKLQELRNIRIQKFKKQGHFLPEEDDKFLERVRAAVEEEERQAAVAADTDAAKDAIATAEESRKAIHGSTGEVKDSTKTKDDIDEPTIKQDKLANEKCPITDADLPSNQQEVDGQGCGVSYDFVANLPPEFYHYYHGSSNDMGTLIEVRRTWDAYIRPGGSRIPGHWVQPPPPADDVWASYLVGPK